MSMIPKVGSSIFNSKGRNKILIRSTSLMHNKSDISTKTNSHFFKSTSKLLNYQNLNNNNLPYIKNQKRTINNGERETNINSNSKEKNYTLNTNSRFFKRERNNYRKFKDLRNGVEFISFNRKDYIIEANKIMNQRFKDKNNDLLGKRSQDKTAILSDTREICRNNFVIEAIKKNMKKIKIKEKNYKSSLIKTEEEMKTDLKVFREFLDSKNGKMKEENEALLNLRDKHEHALEKYDKELQRYKKLSEELEKKVKIICLLKNYGDFIYKILGVNFWLEGVPQINQKTKNFEQIADLVIEKYSLLNNKEQENNEEDFFDDNFLIIKFKELEQRVIQSIKSNELKIRELKEKLYKEEMIDKMNSTLSKLTIKNKDVTKRKTRLIRNIDKAKSIKIDDEISNKYLEYIIELGKETEKCNIDANNYFPNLIPNEEIKVKEYDFHYYTIKTLSNLKKKETLINKFNEYIDDIKNSENRNLIIEIEQELKNKNKKEKLKQLKLKQQQLYYEKNQKALERNTKFVVIGRIVPKIYQFNKNRRSTSRLENKVRDDMELLYYNEDD